MNNSTRPLNVCLVSAAYRPYPSGVSEHVHHLACELHKLGHKVRVLTTNFAGPTEPAGPFPVTRMGRALLIPMNQSYATLPVGIGIPVMVPKFIRRHNFDIIHCHGIFPPEISYWALVGTRVRAAVTFHTYGRLPAEPILKAFRTMFAGLNHRIAARIAVSKAGAAFAGRLFPGRFHIIPNGVDLDRFCPTAPVPAVMAGHQPNILYVGRLDERKGLPVLLRAMPRVVATVPSVRLFAVGHGRLEAECRKLAQELNIADNVVFVGRARSEELSGYYAGCTVYVSPALGGEAMGIVLVEALACGRPVIASSIPGYDEVVQDNVNGILVPPGQTEPLANAVIRVLTSPDLQARLSARAIERAQ
ncbi:MAG: glycosyltransferase family 4 protein, partial [candidate division WOR-3 bacterium]